MKSLFLIFTFLIALNLSKAEARTSVPEMPATVQFEGKTYYSQKTSAGNDEATKILLFYPNLPDHDDEYYQDRPHFKKNGEAVSDIRLGDFSFKTGQIEVQGSINFQLHQLNQECYPYDINGATKYYITRREGGFTLMSWDYAKHRGFGYYSENKLPESQYHLNITEKNKNYTFQKIPHVTPGMLKQVDEAMYTNINFGVARPIDEEEKVENEARYRDLCNLQSDWELHENLQKVDEHRYYYILDGLWSLDAHGSTYIVYEFDDDGSVIIKSLFFFPYPNKEQCLKLYVNATKDLEGEKQLRASIDFRLAETVIQINPKACDLGAGKFSLYGKINSQQEASADVPVLLFYQINKQGQPMLERVIKATEEQAENGKNGCLTNELILSTPETPPIPFQ